MSNYEIKDLLYLMQRLRDPQAGCPWDLAQTFASIAPYTLEEAYEVADAVDRNDLSHLRDELGDLLMQVVFFAQMADEQGAFDFESVVSAITAKLLRRHPHVFPDGTLTSRVGTVNHDTPDAADRRMDASAVSANWEALKQTERTKKGQENLLADVPVALPALKRAQKLQKRVAKVGFDWDEAGQVWQQLQSELEELQTELRGNGTGLREEFGDVLFTLVNLGRHLDVDAEEALRQANRKFTERFEYVESAMIDADIELSRENRERMEAFWQQAKTRGRKSRSE